MPVRLTPLILLVLMVLFAQTLEPAGARVEFLGRDLPHLCPAAHAGGECLGCGTTRATLHMLHGDFGQAWASKPFVFLFPLVFLLEAFLPFLGKSRVRRGRGLLAVGVILLAVIPTVVI